MIETVKYIDLGAEITYLRDHAGILPSEPVQDTSDIDQSFKILENHFCSLDIVFALKFQIFIEECEDDWPEVSVNLKEIYCKTSKLIMQLEELEKFIT